MEFKARSRERRVPIVSQSTSDSKAILSGNHPFLMLLMLDLSFNRTNTTNLLFQLFLGMTIRLLDGLRRFTQLMKVTQLMRNVRKCCCYSISNRLLPV
jgi:hypothetical protein